MPLTSIEGDTNAVRHLNGEAPATESRTRVYELTQQFRTAHRTNTNNFSVSSSLYSVSNSASTMFALE
jgi:hypothetical protein